MADQDIMQLMAQGAPAAAGGDAMSAPPPASDTPPPMPSPMATPEPKAGQREAAMINVSMALDLLEQSLPQIGSTTPEGRKLMSALSSLTAIIGAKKQKTDELQAAEIMQLLNNLPQAAGALPGGSAPGGAPPLPAAPPGPMGAGAGAPPAMPPGMPPGGPTPPM